MDWYEMPLGLGVAFDDNPEAKHRFISMPEPEQRKVIAGANRMNSREEMNAYVRSLAD